jgi:Fic family protein
MGNTIASNHPLNQFAGSLFDDAPVASYVPSPLPRRFGITGDLREIVDAAEWALARLSGASESVPDLESLMRPSIIAEALASAKVDGVHVPLGEALLADSEPDLPRRQNVDETLAIHHMTSVGGQLVRQRPIDRHVAAELHRHLIMNTVGPSGQPGAFRDKAHFVRVPGAGPDAVRAIPAPGDFPALLRDWEDYLAAPPALPLAFRAALTHHRFDTVHPFLEGTGKVGRTLVSLHIMREASLPAPVFGVSRAIDDDLMSYHRATTAVLDSGDIEPWVAYFARLVFQEANRAHQAIVGLNKLRESMREESRDEPLSVFALATLVFPHPVVTVSLVQRTLDLNERHATKVLTRAEKLGWLKPLWRPDSTGVTHWWAPEVWSQHTSEPPTL